MSRFESLNDNTNLFKKKSYQNRTRSQNNNNRITIPTHTQRTSINNEGSEISYLDDFPGLLCNSKKVKEITAGKHDGYLASTSKIVDQVPEQVKLPNGWVNLSDKEEVEKWCKALNIFKKQRQKVKDDMYHIKLRDNWFNNMLSCRAIREEFGETFYYPYDEYLEDDIDDSLDSEDEDDDGFNNVHDLNCEYAF